MEKDDELKGSGNSYDFGARIYDPRLGRWLVVDLLASSYTPLSPYCYVANSPLVLVDPDGNRIIPVDKESEQVLMAAMVDQFGDGNPFKIKNGELKIRWFKMLKIKSQGAVKAELALAMKSAIKNPYVLNFAASTNGEKTVSISANYKTGRMVEAIIDYDPETGEPIYRTVPEEKAGTVSLNIHAGEGHEAKTGPLLGSAYFPTGNPEKPLSDGVPMDDLFTIVNTTLSKTGTFEAEGGGFTDPSMSAIIFHEILDHFDWETRNNDGKTFENDKDLRTAEEQTYWHSKALENQGSKGRAPKTDHPGKR